MLGIFYQFQHPWHWMTYGNNALGVMALSVILVCVSVMRYNSGRVLVRMLENQTRRGSVLPVIYVTFAKEQSDTCEAKIPLSLQNIGAGPGIALSASMGRQPSRKPTAQQPIIEAAATEFEPFTELSNKPISPGSSILVEIARPAWYEDLLFLLDYKDVCGNRYQTQFSFTTYPGQRPTVSCVYAGPWMG